MIVVADTGPINYLLLISKIELLPELFGRVIVPGAVFAELSERKAPELVREWIASAPVWLEVHAVPNPESIPVLGAGEQEAITLAQRLKADVLLIDERQGRNEAVIRGLVIAGTLNILEVASQRGLIDLAASIEQLMRTNFRASPKIIDEFLARHSKAK